MYHVKMAFTLIQVGTNLWINPVQVEGIRANLRADATECRTIIAAGEFHCSDWTIEQVREALKPAAVARALEGK